MNRGQAIRSISAGICCELYVGFCALSEKEIWRVARALRLLIANIGCESTLEPIDGGELRSFWGRTLLSSQLIY